MPLVWLPLGGGAAGRCLDGAAGPRLGGGYGDGYPLLQRTPAPSA